MHTLRDYQLHAVNACFEAWSEMHRPLIAVATGGGKTVILSEIVKRVLAEQAGARLLVLAHTKEIIEQTRATIEKHTGRPLDIAVEMAEQKAPPTSRVVIATRQSLNVRRLERVANPIFTHLLIDEAHHVAPDNQYWRVYQYLRERNPSLKVAGFTATPKRGDNKALGVLFTKVSYRWSILEGIEQGFLVPPTRLQIEADHVQLSDLAVTKGDYDISGLNATLRAARWHELAIAAWLRYGDQRQTIAFFSSIELSEAFVDLAKAKGIAARHIDGTTPKAERESVLAAFKRGEIKVLSNMAVFTEGFDAPQISCILWARPTLSEVLLTQAIGRGLRPFENKRDCLVLDLTPNDTRLVTVAKLVGETVRCFSCGATFFKGFSACPKCGAAIFKNDPKTSKPSMPSGKASALLSGERIDIEGIAVKARQKAIFEGDVDTVSSTGGTPDAVSPFYDFKPLAYWFSGSRIGGFAAMRRDSVVLILKPLEEWDADLAEKVKKIVAEGGESLAIKQLSRLAGQHAVYLYSYDGAAQFSFVQGYPYLEQAIDDYRRDVQRAFLAARRENWRYGLATPKQKGYLNALLKEYNLNFSFQPRMKGEASDSISLIKAYVSLRSTIRTLARSVGHAGLFN